ncbi:MAG: hypothetical protein RB191_13405 [Terriglobia bacterium]|nr:hypothetical protein [Terriglobia bacterium]
MSKRTAEIIFTGDTAKLRSAVQSASGDLKTFGKDSEESSGKLHKIKTAAVGAAIGGIGVLTAGLTKSFEAASAEQQATARMQQAFKNAGVDAASYKGQIDAAEGSGRKLGFTNEQVQSSLGSLVTATHSGKLAFKDLGVAEDLARFKHESLSTASETLQRAMSGSTRAASQLGITIVPVTSHMQALTAEHLKTGTAAYVNAKMHAMLADKMATAQEVIAKTTTAVHGQAQAYASTAAGGMAQFHAQIDNIQAAFGTALLPIMGKVITTISSLVDWMEKHKTIAIILVGVIGSLAGAIAAVSIAQSIAATKTSLVEAAQWLWNAALDANPIGLVVVAIAALVGGIAYLVTQTNIVSNVWHALSGIFTAVTSTIKDVVIGAFDFIKDHLGVIVPIISGIILGPFGLLAGLIATHLDAVKTAITGAWDAIKSVTVTVWDAVKGAITGAWDAIKNAVSAAISTVKGAISGAWDAIKSTTTAVWSGVSGAVTGAWNTIKGTVSSAIGVVTGFVKGLGTSISSIASGMWDGIRDSFKSVINTIIGWWDSLHFTIPKVNIGPIHLGGGTIGLPKIPYLADGGTLTSAGTVMVGERGPEMLSLPKGAQVTPLAGHSAGRGDTTVILTQSGNVTMGSGTAAAKAMADRLAYRAAIGV